MNISPEMIQALMMAQSQPSPQMGTGIMPGEHDYMKDVFSGGKYGMGALGAGMALGGGVQGLTTPGLLMGMFR